MALRTRTVRPPGSGGDHKRHARQESQACPTPDIPCLMLSARALCSCAPSASAPRPRCPLVQVMPHCSARRAGRVAACAPVCGSAWPFLHLHSCVAQAPASLSPPRPASARAHSVLKRHLQANGVLLARGGRRARRHAGSTCCAHASVHSHGVRVVAAAVGGRVKHGAGEHVEDHCEAR